MTVRRAERRGIPLRAVVPNAVTALALCSGLTAIRFAIDQHWDSAIYAILIAAVLDGMDGRIARMLKGQSRFGAELDSLSDVIAFGVAPALILFLWLLAPDGRPGFEAHPNEAWTRFAWLFSLAYAVCMALRLARFNSRMDAEQQPHKSVGYLTGVPAPAGAGLLLVPIYLWLASGWTWLHDYRIVAPWAILVTFLSISSLPTFSWTSFRLRRDVRLMVIVAIALLGGALFIAPWVTLTASALLYVLMIPVSVASYARIMRQRAAAAARMPAPAEPSPPTA